MCEDVGCSYGIPHLLLRHRTKCPAKSRMTRQMLRSVGKCLIFGRYFAHCNVCLFIVFEVVFGFAGFLLDLFSCTAIS